MIWTKQDIAAAINQKFISFKQIFVNNTFVCTEWFFDKSTQTYNVLYERVKRKSCFDETVLIIKIKQLSMNEILSNLEIYPSIRNVSIKWKRSKLNKELTIQLRQKLIENLNRKYFSIPRNASCGMWRLFFEYFLYSCIEQEDHYQIKFIRNGLCMAEIIVDKKNNEILTQEKVKNIVQTSQIIIHQDSTTTKTILLQFE